MSVAEPTTRSDMVAAAGALIAFLWAANPHATTGAAVEARCRKPTDQQAEEAEEAEDEAAASRRRAEEALVQGDYESRPPEFEAILKVFPSDAPGAAIGGRGVASRREVRRRGGGAGARAPLRTPQARSRAALPARRGAVRAQARRRSAARAPHRRARDRHDADRADAQAVAGAHLRAARIRRARRPASTSR